MQEPSALWRTMHPFGKVETSVPLTCCRRMPPPAAALGRVGLDQVGVDHQIRTRAVAQSRRAIRVNLSPANRIGIGRTHHDEFRRRWWEWWGWCSG